jgi:CubicO group peptidase (beta-lactamase class C family)
MLEPQNVKCYFRVTINNNINRRKIKKTILTTLLILMLSQIGLCQSNFDKAKLDNYFNVLEENNKFMGSVAVSKNGEIIYTKTIGLADVEKNIKSTESSKYRIGSISKSFTTVLILKAVEEKKLDINQTIDKWFPTITNAKKITVKYLLSHRSGIHNFTNDKEYLTWNTQSKTEKEMIEIIVKGGSDFNPDSKSEYSNSNFVLLTYILEKTFTKSYSDLLQEFIVKPIGLTNTYVFGKINPKNNECKSYSFAGIWKVEPETDFTIPLGAGAIISTPSDLTKFADALFGGKLLKTESLEIMKTVKDGYGIGLFQIPFYKSIGYGHTGGIDGFTSVYSHFADDKISYALTSNGTNINNNNISIAVLSAVYNKPYEIPVFTTYNLTSEDLDKYLGIYTSKQIPLKITITKDGSTLIAQATGHPASPLDATDKDKFKFDQAGVVLEFNPIDKTMILKQGGREFTFTKE